MSLDSSATPVSCQLQGTFPRPLAKAVLTFDRTSSSKFLSGATVERMTTQRDKQLANYGSIRKHESHQTGSPPWDRPDWLASDVLPGGSTLPNHPVMH